jgi:hypothetical protein
MNEMNLSRVSVALSQQEYTTLPVSNSRVLDSTRLEDRVITHELNAEEVSNLIKAHLCEDLDITNERDYTVIRSDDDKFFGMVKTFQVGNIVLTEEEHDKIIMGASSSDYSSLFIAVTPEGVFQFNLSLLRLDFQAYTNQDKAESFNAADLDVSNGVQILEWYPEFASEDDYIDALMSNGDEIGVWEEGDEW